jgi:hypothetical protein
VIEQGVEAAAVELARELGIPVAQGAALSAIERADGYEMTQQDGDDLAHHQAQMLGQFLIDRAGIARWASTEDLLNIARFPTDQELLDAARNL